MSPSPAGGATAWRPSTAAAAFVGALGLAIAGRATVTGEGAGPLQGGALIMLNAAPVALALLLANLHAAPTARDFGLRRPPLRRAVGLTVAVWLGLTALTLLWVVALGLDGDEGQALTDRLGTEGTLTVLILIVVVTVLGPLGEEVLFRGYIFRAFRNGLGVWPAAVATAVLFAATHLGWTPTVLIVPVLLSGVGLCLLYHWTESLYPPIALHALSNAIPLGAALDWTWQTPLLVAGSTLAALILARLLARALPTRRA